MSIWSLGFGRLSEPLRSKLRGNGRTQTLFGGYKINPPSTQNQLPHIIKLPINNRLQTGRCADFNGSRADNSGEQSVAISTPGKTEPLGAQLIIPLGHGAGVGSGGLGVH